MNVNMKAYAKEIIMLLFCGTCCLATNAQGVVSRKKTTQTANTKKTNRTAKKPNVSVSNPSGYANGHGYVDLGLSVKWATCNIGASSPSDYGDYYAWGETSTKKNYGGNTYIWYGSEEDPYMLGKMSGIQNSIYDVAHIKWGESWRLPTKDEIQELITKCTWNWTFVNGVLGYKVCRMGRSIFLPASAAKGYPTNYKLKYGCYLSSNADDKLESYCITLFF